MAMTRTESTSPRLAKMAGEILAGRKATQAEAKSLAGCVLTQVEAETAGRDLLKCAVDDWEQNNGRIISNRDPHWTVAARKLLHPPKPRKVKVK